MTPLRGLLRVGVRIFFRRIAIAGGDQVPATGPVLFVLNHPNSLIDPVLLLAFAPRPVVFLAKEPLFRTPVVRWFVRAMGSIPVYRRQDAADMTQNRHTFARVWEVMQRGGAVALFPEGGSHNDPTLRPLKTGAARLALGATAIGSGRTVSIVPAGLYYTAKWRFRSSAVLRFGAPITVSPGQLDANGEPESDAVRALTARLEEALADVTLQADRQEALDLVAMAERVFSSTATAPDAIPPLERRFELRQEFMRGYQLLRTTQPGRIARLERDLERYLAELDAAGLAPESVPPVRLSFATASGYAARTAGFLLVTAPLAVIGIVVHLPAYLVIGPFVTRALDVERDVFATGKMLVAGLLYPITWAIITTLVWRRLGAAAGVITLAILPLSGYVALLFVERFDRLVGAARGVLLRIFRRRAWLRLDARRRRIAAEIEDLAALRTSV